jgi:hypothetical protein
MEAVRSNQKQEVRENQDIYVPFGAVGYTGKQGAGGDGVLSINDVSH